MTRPDIAQHAAAFEQARQILASGRPLSRLEFSGLVHVLYVSSEKAIYQASRWLEQQGHEVPAAAYDVFSTLARLGLLPADDLPAWSTIINLRNHIVHDCLNLDEQLIQTLVQERKEQLVSTGFFVAGFSGLRPLPRSGLTSQNKSITQQSLAVACPVQP